MASLLLLLLLLLFIFTQAFDDIGDIGDIGSGPVLLPQSSAWDVLTPHRTPDTLCTNCSNTPSELVACADIYTITEDVYIHPASGDHTDLPAQPQKLAATFSEAGEMVVQWTVPTANLDKLEGYYMEVEDMAQRKQARLFDVRSAQLTVEKLHKAGDFVYSCFPPDFLTPNWQLRIVVQTLPPITTPATLDVTVPKRSTIAVVTTPRAPTLHSWTPRNVSVTPLTWKAALRLTFPPAPGDMGVMEYYISMQDNRNNTVRKTVDANKVDAGSVAVEFAGLCEDGAPLPTVYTIEASAENGAGGCLCVPDKDWVDVSSPCQHPCPVTAVANTVTYTELCGGSSTVTPAEPTTGLTAEPTVGPIAGLTAWPIVGIFMSALVVCGVLAACGWFLVRRSSTDVRLVCGSANNDINQLLELLKEYLSDYLPSITIHQPEGGGQEVTTRTLLLRVPPTKSNNERSQDDPRLRKCNMVELKLDCCICDSSKRHFHVPNELQQLLAHVKKWPSCLMRSVQASTSSQKWHELKEEIARLYPSTATERNDESGLGQSIDSVSLGIDVDKAQAQNGDKAQDQQSNNGTIDIFEC